MSLCESHSQGDGEVPNAESPGEIIQGMSEVAHLEIRVVYNTCPRSSGNKYVIKRMPNTCHKNLSTLSRHRQVKELEPTGVDSGPLFEFSL